MTLFLIFSFRLSFLVKYIEIFREDLNSTAYMLSNSHHFIRIEQGLGRSFLDPKSAVSTYHLYIKMGNVLRVCSVWAITNFANEILKYLARCRGGRLLTEAS